MYLWRPLIRFICFDLILCEVVWCSDNFCGVGASTRNFIIRFITNLLCFLRDFVLLVFVIGVIVFVFHMFD
jgi:hypothetical protein